MIKISVHFNIMSFGSCCIKVEEKIKSMITKSIIINGYQKGMLVNYEVTQTFYHSEKEAQEVNYVFPNDHKMCIYDTSFIIGKEIIKPVIRPKEEAKQIYENANKTGNTAIVVTNIDHGTTAVKIANIEPNIECKVIFKLVFPELKFPLDVYTPYGSENCFTLDSSQFLFQL